MIATLLDYLLSMGVIEENEGRISGPELKTENVITILKFVSTIARIAQSNVMKDPDSTSVLKGCWGVSDWADAEIRSVLSNTCDKIYEIYNDPRSKGNRLINVGIVVTD